MLVAPFPVLLFRLILSLWGLLVLAHHGVEWVATLTHLHHVLLLHQKVVLHDDLLHLLLI